VEALKGKNICLITSGHIASNPRLLKEAKALSSQGARVNIVAVQTLELLEPFDLAIAARFPDWNCHFVSITASALKPRWRRYWSGLRQRVFRYIEGFGLWPGIYSFCRLYPEQLRVARQVPADLYIAHNLAALPVAAHAAALYQVPYAFDAEDFHRGESDNASPLVAVLEQQFFPGAVFLSAASPLIAATYGQLFPKQSFQPINNVFSLAQQVPFQTLPPEPLKLFWFSQTVGLNRGLQDVLLAMQLVPEIPIQVTVVGFCEKNIEEELRALLQSSQHQLNLIPQVAEDRLFELAAEHHIGLALELSTPLNRDICLTNKIFTYLLAGNAIIASDTRAQRAFMTEYPGVGWTYTQGEPQALARILKNCYTQPSDLAQTRNKAWILAKQQLNWEMEQKKWLPLVEAALSA